MRHICLGSLIIWFGILAVLPPLFAVSHGFKNNLYRNGMIAIDARSQNHCFYTLRLANSLAFHTDNHYLDEWYEKAIEESESGHDNYLQLVCYVDYMFYQVKSGYGGSLKNTIEAVTEKFELTEIKKEVLEDDGWEYDRTPYRQELIDILSQ